MDYRGTSKRNLTNNPVIGQYRHGKTPVYCIDIHKQIELLVVTQFEISLALAVRHLVHVPINRVLTLTAEIFPS